MRLPGRPPQVSRAVQIRNPRHADPPAPSPRGRRRRRPRAAERADARQRGRSPVFRGRSPSPCSPAVACRATPLRARPRRTYRPRIFAANSGVPRARRRLLRPRAPLRLRGSALPPRPPPRAPGRCSCRGVWVDASSRLAPPAGATRRRGQRRRRRRPRRRNGCGLKQALLRSGARVDAAAAHVRRGGSHPSCAPADGEAAGFAARSRAPRRLPATGAERRELTQCLATPHLRDDGRHPSRSSRSSPRPCGSSRVPRRSPRPAHPRLLRLPALSTCVASEARGRPR